MRPPSRGLGNRGRALFASVQRALPFNEEGEQLEFDEREVALLTMAARQADDVQRLEAVVKRQGPMVAGSTGQPVVNPALIEARQGRLAITRLLGELSIPDEAGEPRTARSLRAQHAAETRHNQLARKREQRAARGA